MIPTNAVLHLVRTAGLVSTDTMITCVNVMAVMPGRTARQVIKKYIKYMVSNIMYKNITYKIYIHLHVKVYYSVCCSE